MMDTVHTKKEIIADLGKHSIEIQEVVESIDHSTRKEARTPHYVWMAIALFCVAIGFLFVRPDLRRRLCASSDGPSDADNILTSDYYHHRFHTATDLNLAVITWNVGEIPLKYFTGSNKTTNDGSDPFEELLSDLDSMPDVLVGNFQEVSGCGGCGRMCLPSGCFNNRALKGCVEKILEVLNRNEPGRYMCLKAVLPGRAMSMTGSAIFVKTAYRNRFRVPKDDYVTFGYTGTGNMSQKGESKSTCCKNCLVGFRCNDKRNVNDLDKTEFGNKLSIIILLEYVHGDIRETFTFVNSHFAPHGHKRKWLLARRQNAKKTVEAIQQMHGGQSIDDIDFVFWGADFNLRRENEYENIPEFRDYFQEEETLGETYKFKADKWGSVKDKARKPQNQYDCSCDRVIYRVKNDDAITVDKYNIVEATTGFSDHKAVQLLCTLNLARNTDSY